MNPVFQYLGAGVTLALASLAVILLCAALGGPRQRRRTQEPSAFANCGCRECLALRAASATLSQDMQSAMDRRKRSESVMVRPVDRLGLPVADKDFERRHL